MSLVRLLGFSRLPCGCVVGRYRDVGRRREVVYVEEKGPACTAQGHRRNQTVRPAGLSRRRSRSRSHAPPDSRVA